jgi:hypothetical protein
MGFFRQLTSAEIFEQVQRFSAELRRSNDTQGMPQRLSNVVMMGMGEPLANYENVMTAVKRMNTELGIGARHITISTVGLAPRIRKLADEDMQVSKSTDRLTDSGDTHSTRNARYHAVLFVKWRIKCVECVAHIVVGHPHLTTPRYPPTQATLHPYTYSRHVVSAVHIVHRSA